MDPPQPVSRDCKVKVRKYVLILQPSRWPQKRERVVVQSPVLIITRDVSFLPVRVLNGEEHNLVCFLPRQDIERDSSDTHTRQHVSNAQSNVEAHGTALCNSSPNDDFLYVRDDRFWIYNTCSTDATKDNISVINLRTYQSGAIPIDHVSWFPRIQSTSISFEKEARPELWTLGGPNRRLKLAGSKNFSLWSFVICQFTDETKSIAKTVNIPAKDNQSETSRYLSLSESNSIFESRCTRKELDGDSLLHPMEILLPTPPTSPELAIKKDTGKGKWKEKGEGKAVVSTSLGPDHTDAMSSVWMRIQNMANCRSSQTDQYVLKDSPIHTRDSHSVIDSEHRDRSASISTAANDYDNDTDSSFHSTTSNSRDISPSPGSDADADYEKKKMKGRHLNGGIMLKEFAYQANEDLGKRPDMLAFSAADPSIARDPTRIKANWEANKPGHNPKLDDLCQSNSLDCQYTTKYTCKHYHPDPEKCSLTRLELYDAEPGNFSREWMAWARSNSSSPQQDRHVDHEHCISRERPYPGGAGGCMLAGVPPWNHVCCLWDQRDLDDLDQIWARAYNKSRIADAERHRVTIFDQSNLVRTETRLLDIGIIKDQLIWPDQTVQLDLHEGLVESGAEYEELDEETLDVGKRNLDVARILGALG